jgi:hypothetical protein
MADRRCGHRFGGWFCFALWAGWVYGFREVGFVTDGRTVMAFKMVVWGVSPDWKGEQVLDLYYVDSVREGEDVLAEMGWTIGETNSDNETVTYIEFRART